MRLTQEQFYTIQRRQKTFAEKVTEQLAPIARAAQDKKPLQRHEEQKQIALMDWAQYVAVGNRKLAELLVHCPNGGARSGAEASRFKAMGVQAGFPDLFLTIPAGGFHGAAWELKHGDGRLTSNQHKWHQILRDMGYYVNTYWDLGRVRARHRAISRAKRIRDYRSSEGAGMNGFMCKRCKLPKPLDQQVVTRFPTKICRECWSYFVAKGHRTGTNIPVANCMRCGVNPRPVLDNKRRGVCDTCHEKENDSGKQLIPRETHDLSDQRHSEVQGSDQSSAGAVRIDGGEAGGRIGEATGTA